MDWLGQVFKNIIDNQLDNNAWVDDHIKKLKQDIRHQKYCLIANILALVITSTNALIFIPYCVATKPFEIPYILVVTALFLAWFFILGKAPECIKLSLKFIRKDRDLLNEYQEMKEQWIKNETEEQKEREFYDVKKA